jgi:hypothetical protein
MRRYTPRGSQVTKFQRTTFTLSTTGSTTTPGKFGLAAAGQLYLLLGLSARDLLHRMIPNKKEVNGSVYSKPCSVATGNITETGAVFEEACAVLKEGKGFQPK